MKTDTELIHRRAEWKGLLIHFRRLRLDLKFISIYAKHQGPDTDGKGTIRGYTRGCPLYFGGVEVTTSPGDRIMMARRRREKMRFLNTENVISKGGTM